MAEALMRQDEETVCTPKARTWHLWVDDTPRPGWYNMAIDRALLDRVESADESWLRLYTWEPHCLSFGRHEPASRRYDPKRIASLGLDTVRRPTGGRAVWHSRELTYAVAAPCRTYSSLRQAYLDIHGTLAVALRSLGVPAWLAAPQRTLPVGAGACFAQAVGGEVMVGTSKVVGSAQLRRASAFLQHGSILLQDEQRLVSALMKGEAAPFMEAPALLREDRSLADLISAISRSVQSHWPGTWQTMSCSGETLQAATQYFGQFRSAAWTWER
jgi:lipoate-protein ligase A